MKLASLVYPGLVAGLLLPTCLPVSAQTTGLTELCTFIGSSNGASPNAGLIQGRDGNFYGTTKEGGNGVGTVFELTPAGVLTTLHAFSAGSDEGYSPTAGLVQGSDGNFYGTTSAGGPSQSGFGSVFQITPAGVVTTLHNFGEDANGTTPLSGLVQGSDGNFYGTTSVGGTDDNGTIFSITPAGVFTTLYRFSGSDGASPETSLVQGSDGNFYGTTSSGGTSGGDGSGTLFKITPAGVLSTLYSFGTGVVDGVVPNSPLVQGRNGNFYGTTLYGGANEGNGTVFEATLSGTVSFLYDFAGFDGSGPTSVIQGSDGNFYGTTEGGAGLQGTGTIFQLTPEGILTTFYQFLNGAEGEAPKSLLEGNDGNFYGVTGNASLNFGTVFQLNPLAVTKVSHPTVTVSVAGDGRAQYGVEKGIVIFRRTGDTSQPLSLTYRTKGSAQVNVDYKAPPALLTIPAGAAQLKLKIKPLDNPANTGKRKLKVYLLPPYTFGAYTVGSPFVAPINIIGGK